MVVKGHTYSKGFPESTGPISFEVHMQPSSKGGRGGGGRGEECLHISSRSHDQDGLHAHIL